jgi:hypothetical protein
MKECVENVDFLIYFLVDTGQHREKEYVYFKIVNIILRFLIICIYI